MGSVSELSLDYKPNTTYPLPIQAGPDDQEQTQKKNIEDFISRLEEERLKIEAFKRELPLCMQLINSAMETYRQQLGTYQKKHLAISPPCPAPAVMEEFIPFTDMSINSTEKNPTVTPSEKSSWMESAQLWSPTALSEPTKQCSSKLALDSKERNRGAFLPFSQAQQKMKGSAGSVSSPELALANSSSTEKLDINGGDSSKSTELVQQGKVVGGGSKSESQLAHRKARRCWSPDLHRRFVNALQMLGGSQVATPKQIREVMKVDGLTNDEVKSHLQKYRLHTRRPIPHPQPTAASGPQLVVLGGIWVPPEYAAAAAAGPAIYGAHQQAHRYDFYAAPQHHHVHHLHHGTVPGPAVPYKASTIHSPPDPELRSGGGGDHRSDSLQEEKDDDKEEEDSEDQEEDIKNRPESREANLVPNSNS